MIAYEKKRIYESYIDSGSKAGLFKSSGRVRYCWVPNRQNLFKKMSDKDIDMTVP